MDTERLMEMNSRCELHHSAWCVIPPRLKMIKTAGRILPPKSGSNLSTNNLDIQTETKMGSSHSKASNASDEKNDITVAFGCDADSCDAYQRLLAGDFSEGTHLCNQFFVP